MTAKWKRSLLDDLDVYVERIAELRRHAAPAQRDAYTVALGQLRSCGLIEEDTWREALDRPSTYHKQRRTQ